MHAHRDRPSFVGSPSEQVRERLHSAGLLAEQPFSERDATMDWERVTAAGAVAAIGTPLSDLVVDGR